MAVYGYCRVSTAGQVDRESLGAQERTIKGKAYALGHEMDKVQLFVEEGISASLPIRNRPAGSKMMNMVQTGDVIIVAFFDRMFRDSLDALTTLHYCRDNNITLHIEDLGGDVLNSPFSTAMFTIIAALAQLRREEIAGRVKWAKRDQKARGRYLGGTVPFGFRLDDNGALEEDSEQQRALAVARDLHGKGTSLRKISAHLLDLGHKVSHVTLSGILNGK
jgi:DNA invertase Pin-like site-specific DNA recombinase